MTTPLPNPFLSNSVDASPAESVAPSRAPETSAVPQAAAFNPAAKATKGKAGTAEVTGLVRRSTAGTGLRVGEASADLPATSEIMDVTAGETAPLSNSAGCIPAESAAALSPPAPDSSAAAGRFVLDPIAFYEAIEPMPLFLRGR